MNNSPDSYVRKMDSQNLRQDLGLSRKVLARLAGLSERTVAAWEAGEPLDRPASERMREVCELVDALAKVVQPAAIPSWLEAPNPAFGGLKPLEVIERGEADRIRRMIFYLESGIAS